MQVPQTASAQWAYKANVATSRAPTSKGWAKYLSSNGWPKVAPRLSKHVGARVEDRLTGRRGTVLRGTPSGWLVVEYDDQTMGTPSLGQLEIIEAAQTVKRPVKRQAAPDRSVLVAELRARIAELESALRIATLQDDALPVIRERWAA